MDRIKTGVLAALLLCQALAVAQAQQLPQRGMTQDEVRDQFGSPRKTLGPVGDPPISRWVYDGFTVYFEGRYTLHSVQHPQEETADPQRKQQQPAHPEAGESAGSETGPADQQPSETATTEADSGEPAAGETADKTHGEAKQSAQQAQEKSSGQPKKKESKAGFHFDPDTGRIIEEDEKGNAVDSPTAQEGPSAGGKAEAEDTAAGQQAEKPVKDEQHKPEDEQTKPAEASSKTGKQKAEPESESEARTEPETEPKPEPKPKSESEPKPEPKPESPQKPDATEQSSESGESSGPVRATRPESEKQKDRQDSGGGGERNFRFDPSTGRIVPTDE